MDNQLKDKLLEDRVKADEAISEVIRTGNNFYVVGAYYLTPTVINKQMEINEKYGEFQYFSRIRQALEYALITGKIPSKIKISDTIPPYLKEFIE